MHQLKIIISVLTLQYHFIVFILTIFKIELLKSCVATTFFSNLNNIQVCTQYASCKIDTLVTQRSRFLSFLSESNTKIYTASYK